jgi:K+-transporting ATPase ATPase C chain
MHTFIQQARIAATMLIVFTVMTGLLYPLAITGVAQGLFQSQADGSLITNNGQVVGSSLVGQSFVDSETGYTLSGYFRGRPSAAGDGYDASLSGGSNYGPLSESLRNRVTNDLAIIRGENDLQTDAVIPVDLVTASASGLDPHISPASAEIQVARVARERGLSEDTVRDLVREHTSSKLMGFFGEERVNVLELNLALDELSTGQPAR